MKRVMVWVLLIEGLASAGIQMLSIRQSVGHVGSSVLTASVVIAAFLLALALPFSSIARFWLYVCFFWSARTRRVIKPLPWQPFWCLP